jgi:hypothetical protein
METKALLKELRIKKIFLKNEGEDMVYKAPKGVLTDLLRNELMQKKEELKQLLSEAIKNRSVAIEAIPLLPELEYYDLSHGQKRFVILDELETGITTHNMFTSHMLIGKLNRQVLQEVFNRIIERHEILRTTFVKRNDVYKQKINSHEKTGFKVMYYDWKGQENIEERRLELEKEELICRFNIAEGPLFRASLIEIEPEKHIFYLTLHHIISDGWSQEVMLRDVVFFYNALKNGEEVKIEPLKVQYKEYASWLNGKLKGKEGQDLETYWLNEFKTPPPLIDLPMDFSRPKTKNHLGMSYTFTIEGDRVQKLRDIAMQHGITLYVFFFAVLKTLIYRYTGVEDITVGTPLASRDHPQLENQIGFYVNTLAFRTQLKGDQSFKSLMNKINDKNNENFRNQMYPFDLLVDKLGFKRDLSRHPLFDIFFTYENARDRKREMKFDHIRIDALPVGHCMDKFDLEFTVIEDTEERIECYLNYSTSLFKKETIEKFAEHLLALSDQAIGNMDSFLNEFELLAEEPVSTDGIAEMSEDLFDFDV